MLSLFKYAILTHNISTIVITRIISLLFNATIHNNSLKKMMMKQDILNLILISIEILSTSSSTIKKIYHLLLIKINLKTIKSNKKEIVLQMLHHYVN